MTQDDRDTLPIVPSLAVRPGQTDAAPSAEQGPAPADLATREAPHIPTPSGEGLSADAVSALLGESGQEVETNFALEQAEGLTPGTES